MADVKETVGVKDDIGAEMIENQRNSLLAQKEMFTKNIAQVKAGYDNYKAQWDIENRIWEIRVQYGTAKVTPTFEYENNSEYRELVDKMQAYKYREEKHLAEGALDGFLAQLKDLQEQLSTVEEQLKELEADA
jgi:hypothetical protein